MPGTEAVKARGWLLAHKWLLARRAAQIGFLAMFLSGPFFGLWIAKGTLASSLTFGVLPLTDPLILLQSLVAGHISASSALIGAAIVLVAYGLLGGRTYCAWVCPVNPLTDAAHWLRQKIGFEKGWQPPRSLRLWVLGMVVVVSGLTGTVAWEWLNPVTVLHRGLVFGTLFAGFGWLVIAGVLIFDLALSRHGWCGHVCPVGAFYGLIGRVSALRVSASGRARCDDCMDCFLVCPEPHVITPALRGGDRNLTPVILSGDCSNCGRCLDVCTKGVFRFSARNDRRVYPGVSDEDAEFLKKVA